MIAMRWCNKQNRRWKIAIVFFYSFCFEYDGRTLSDALQTKIDSYRYKCFITCKQYIVQGLFEICDALSVQNDVYILFVVVLCLRHGIDILGEPEARHEACK